MIALLVTLIVWALIFYVAWWGIGAMALPEPFTKILTVILVLAIVYVLYGIFTGSVAPFHIPTTLN